MKAKISLQVIIVGAGMGGLGTAISLRRAGHKVVVLEQAPEFIEASHLLRFTVDTCLNDLLPRS